MVWEQGRRKDHRLRKSRFPMPCASMRWGRHLRTSAGRLVREDHFRYVPITPPKMPNVLLESFSAGCAAVI